jgi:hypothetical protein
MVLPDALVAVEMALYRGLRVHATGEVQSLLHRRTVPAGRNVMTARNPARSCT